MTIDMTENNYNKIKDALLKAFYYQRCGIELSEEYASIYKHKPCHISLAVLQDDPSQKLDVSGGWHDAGDYGRYVVAAAKAVADLLLSYELKPEVYKNKIGIPESKNDIPDILNEVRYELEWLLKMQDIKSGAVYHKVATYVFPPFIMPEDDKEKLIISPISSAATADFAAALALASRIYKTYDEEFSDKMLIASQKAWEWLEKNPNYLPFKNPVGMKSGEYGDKTDKDERFWAAVELFKATRDEKYHKFITSVYKDEDFDKLSLGWADVGGYGTISYLTLDKDLQNNKIYEYLLNLFIDKADQFVRIAKANLYNVSLNSDDYIWGSNMLVLNRAMHLIYANIFTGNDEYYNFAKKQLHYILGNNPLSMTYITGIGAKSPRYPHHRPSGADGIDEPVPGLVVGGPNGRFQDSVIKEYLPKTTPPEKAYIDHEGSYSTNEVAIYWNSPAVFVTAFFCQRT